MDRLIALVLLRWRLELRGAQRAPERAAGLIFVTPFLLAGGVFAGLAVFLGTRALEAGHPDLVVPALSALATFFGLFWMVSPLLAGVTLAETHDPTRLLHFPIPFPSLVASSMLANLLQPFLLMKLPVVLGAAAALADGPASFPLTLAGVLLSLFFMLAAVQVTGLVFLGMARQRRFHDLSLFLALALGFLLSLAPLALFTAGPGPLRFLLRVVVDRDALALSPFAWGARAAAFAGRGELAPALGFATAEVAAIAGAMALSAVLLRRIHQGERDLAGGVAPGSAVRARMRFGGELGTLFEKDLRVAWRDPALKAGLFVSLMGPLLFVILFARSTGRGGGGVLMLAAFVGLSVFGTNTFGLERRGIGLLLSFPVERWRILVAKNLAAISLRLPGILMLVVAALFLGPAEILPAALTIALVGLLVSAALDNYASILFPFPAPEPGRPPAAGGGRGLAALAMSGILLTAGLALASPFMLLAALPMFLGRPWLWLGALPLAVAGAAAVYAMLIAGAEHLLARRERDVLERILTGEPA